jgi:hypothetical protein
MMFSRDPFDIAPGANRHAKASWVTLAIGLLFAVGGASLLAKSLGALEIAGETAKQAAEATRLRAASEAAVRAKRSDPAAIERMKAQQRLQQTLRMSWSGLLNALEFAGQQVEGHATVVSLVPSKMQADAAEVGITGLAVSNQAVLDYVEALQKDSHVRDVRLAMQQPALNGTVPVVRFQLYVLWEPLVLPVPIAQSSDIRATQSGRSE